MTARHAENATADYYDNQARDYTAKAVSWEEQADKTPNPKSKQKYLQTAQEYRQKAIEARKSANIAAQER